ncbi:hypothetical protein E4U09_008170 [Claviceps aff. purpurea]|uniref:Uncharacterized protein n=1 Tax=Claviceps aff. purpurea TaxID=1967640 RepID=A0A9P7QM23_9HYPO|nr:hypothetical protein E4U09_008170 [Claviceps aff. purpurea]
MFVELWLNTKRLAQINRPESMFQGNARKLPAEFHLSGDGRGLRNLHDLQLGGVAKNRAKRWIAGFLRVPRAMHAIDLYASPPSDEPMVRYDLATSNLQPATSNSSRETPVETTLPPF